VASTISKAVKLFGLDKKFALAEVEELPDFSIFDGMEFEVVNETGLALDVEFIGRTITIRDLE
jgi:hypothetical protein